MSLLPHQLELLSPARDADIGIEAINHGADAVYIGGPAFGARASAGNDIRDIERLVKHAHRFNSRIFITLNTILRDDELEAARQMAWQVYEAGADALIIQDMGLLEIDLPPIQLHASTQTDIRTPEKARFLQDAGLSQSVLARELTVQQIAAVHKALGPVDAPASYTCQAIWRAASSSSSRRMVLSVMKMRLLKRWACFTRRSMSRMSLPALARAPKAGPPM